MSLISWTRYAPPTLVVCGLGCSLEFGRKLRRSGVATAVCWEGGVGSKAAVGFAQSFHSRLSGGSPLKDAFLKAAEGCVDGCMPRILSDKSNDGGVDGG